VTGGIPAGPDAVAGAFGTVCAALDSGYDRLADWAERQPLAPASAAGISLIFGICAAAWFTAGTRAGNLYGALAVAAGYLVALGSREFLSPAPALLAGPPADLPAARVAGSSPAAGLVAGTKAARAAWLGMLGARLSEYAVYVGLAIGATAEGWRGVWPLTIGVLGLAAVCDTMAVCSSVARPAEAAPGQAAPAGTGAGLDDTIPDVPAWGGTAPDVVRPDGSAPAVSAPLPPPPSPHDDLPRPGDLGAAGAGSLAARAAEPGQPGLGGIVGRILLTALGMPPGGRVLLIALAAPVFGAQPTLVGLLDWGIIGVGYGIGSRTAARRRDRAADQRDEADPAETRADPGGLAMLLQPAQPARSTYPPEMPLDGPQDPVGADDAELDRAAYATELTATAAFDSAAFAGEPSLGAALGLAYPGEKGPGQPAAGPARPIPARPGASPARAAGPPASGLSIGRLFGGRGGSAGAGARAAGPDDDAVYDWADDGWTDGGAEAGPAAGTSRGAVTAAELSDQDEWDAELAAAPPLPEDAAPAAPAGRTGYPARTDYPTLAERLGLGRGPAPSGDLGANGEPGADRELGPAGDPGAGGGGPRDGAGYADLAGGSAAAALAGRPYPRAESGVTGRAAAEPGAAGSGSAAVLRNRDDGAVARWFGSLVRGQLMPLPAALLALAAVAMLAHLGLRDLPGLLILAPALVMLVAAPGASHRHDGRFDWLAPAVLQGAQYVYIGALGFATGVPAPITFLLCAAVALHYADLGSAGSPILLAVRRAGSPQADRRSAARPGRPARPRRSLQQRLGQTRPGQTRAGQGRPGQVPAGSPPGRRAGRPADQRPPATELGMWMGWEGRMIVVGLGAAMGVAMFAYLALAGYLGWLIFGKIRSSYLGLREGDVR
jgi:hypothetical protein